MKYTHEYQQGRIASSEERCPYPVCMLGRRCAWLAGFTPAVSRRLRDAERRAESRAEQARPESTGRSVSLVLADRSAVVSAAVTDEYPYLRKAKARQLSGSGGRSGWQAGQRADLGTGSRVSARRRGQIAG